MRRGEEASGLEAAISGIVNHQDAANRSELQNFTRVHLCGGGGGVTCPVIGQKGRRSFPHRCILTLGVWLEDGAQPILLPLIQDISKLWRSLFFFEHNRCYLKWFLELVLD